MLEKIHLPLWAQHCFEKGRIVFEENENGSVTVLGCESINECYGCDPVGTTILINPTKLELIGAFNSMNFKPSELNGVWMTDKIIKRRLKKYKDAEEKYFWFRGISCDLDTVKIWRIKHAVK